MGADDKGIEYFEDEPTPAAAEAELAAAVDAEPTEVADAEPADTAAADAEPAAAADPASNAEPSGAAEPVEAAEPGQTAAEADPDGDGQAAEEELYELELDEGDIVAYLEDEYGAEIGFVVVEDGEEVEYYYAEEDGVEYVSADDGEPEAADDEELYELEFSEDDVVAYLEDEYGAEIGFVIVEDGEEVEYYYAAEDDAEREDSEKPAARKESERDDDCDLGITREGIAATTADLNAVFKEGVATGVELKDAISDITGVFSDIAGKGSSKRKRR